MRAALLAAARFHSLHDLIALFPEAVHINDFFGRMLKVAVEHDYAFALCLIEPGKNCCLLAEISGKTDTSYTGVTGSRFLDLFPGPVF